MSYLSDYVTILTLAVQYPAAASAAAVVLSNVVGYIVWGVLVVAP